MNKSDLIAAVADHAEVSGSDVRRVLDALAEIALARVSLRNELMIPGIGKLKVSRRNSRIGRDPRTGKTIEIAARDVVSMTISKALKDGVAAH